MSGDREILQRLIDTLYRDRVTVSRLDVILQAESSDFPPELLEIVNLLPPLTYKRHVLCDQLNSSLKGHGWTRRFGTVD